MIKTIILSMCLAASSLSLNARAQDERQYTDGPVTEVDGIPNPASAGEHGVEKFRRCFAYMKLGELNKALEDCTMSLRYGRLPDALQKQQQLQKLLSGQTT